MDREHLLCISHHTMLLRQPLRIARSAQFSALVQRRLASSLVFLEHKGGKLNDSSLHAVTAAQKVDGEVSQSPVGIAYQLTCADIRTSSRRKERCGQCLGRSQEVGSALNMLTQLTDRIDGLAKIYTASSDAYSHSLAESQLSRSAMWTFR